MPVGGGSQSVGCKYGHDEGCDTQQHRYKKYEKRPFLKPASLGLQFDCCLLIPQGVLIVLYV